jgi:hypothetical protein
MENELLDSPREQLARPNFVLRHARECVNPAKLSRLVARDAELTQQGTDNAGETVAWANRF